MTPIDIYPADFIRQCGGRSVAGTPIPPAPPTDIANLLRWDDSDASRVTRTGALVDSLAARFEGSPQLDMIAAGAVRPTWGASVGTLAAPGIVYAGAHYLSSQDAVVAAAIDVVAPFTWVSVFERPVASGTFQGNYCLGRAASVANSEIAISLNSNAGAAAFSVQRGGSAGSSGAAGTNVPMLVVQTFNGSFNRVYRNGTLHGSSNFVATSVTCDRLYYGAVRTGGAFSSFFDGIQYENLFYGRVLTASEIDSLEEYYLFTYPTLPIVV